MKLPGGSTVPAAINPTRGVLGERRQERLGLLYAAGAGILFGSSYVATAYALRSFEPVSATAWRGILGTLGLSILIARGVVQAGGRGIGRSILARLVVLGILGGPGIIVGTNVAVSLVGAAVTSFVAGLYAVLAAMLAIPVLGERLRLDAVAGLVTAFAGTALLAELWQGTASAFGVFAALLGASSYALFLVLSRRWSRSKGLEGPAVAFLTVAASGFGLMGIEAILSPGSIVPRSIDPLALIGLIWVAIAATWGQLLIVASLRRIDARRSSALLLLGPPTAALLAWVLLGQTLRPLQIGGAALVLCGIAAVSGILRSFSRPTAGQ